MPEISFNGGRGWNPAPTMDKREAKRLGAWISLLGGLVFVLGAVAAIYIAFFLKPESAVSVLAWMGRHFHYM